MLLSTPGKIFTRMIQNKDSGGQVVVERSSGIQEGEIMSRSNCSTENYHRSITRVEIINVHQLHRFREGI